MSNHTASYFADPDMAIAGHNSSLVYVHQTKVTGLHCEDCGWYGGSFRRDFKIGEKDMRKAWAKHVAFVQEGGVIEHELASNVGEGICLCTRCSLPWRAQRRAEEGRT
ncbi:hypothetical protein Rhe02_54560 [Rhizocola hellebori]|uniref:Uncharacterized protein n=1 Tax=Rhizocola hellebori TaxID=1392758 RepID=A0A8J3VHG7_9ACTN|nr:hypothetical protein [Rhizocola hellebori]GIH07389.1 hypothetical protein Rhe02_54560 [Rhizocola hellebori]